jgi:Domain of unknown function (DUF309)
MASGMGFDLAAHLSALVATAMDERAKAPAVGWLAAFGREVAPAPAGDAPGVALDRLRAAFDALPAGPWREGADPRVLMEALPVFAVAGPDGQLRTEPRELMDQDWGSPDDRLVLLPALADRLPYLQGRAGAYLDVLREWYGSGSDAAAGFARACRMFAALYNARLHLEAYKLLEVRWMMEQGAQREVLRGLMQIAVGLHQVASGKYAVPQLEEGYGRLRANAEAFPAPTIGRFLKRLARAIRLIKAYGPEAFRKFDLELFPRLWMVSPWRLLFTFGRAR